MLRVAEQAHKSDTGQQRQANEDAYFARAPVFAVADGMGGAQAGEVASRIAVDAFEPGIPGGQPPEQALRQLAELANRKIHEFAGDDSERAGMGTTLTAAVLAGEEVSLVHAGDSRAYLLRERELRRLTQDHSLVEELRRQGRLTAEEAEEHPQRSIITRALGPEPQVELDTMSVTAQDGDVFLLCSDGLTTMVSETRIAIVLASSPSLEAAVAELVDEANRMGGRDNITVVAFRVEELRSGAPPADPADGATLLGSTAEQEGLTAEAIRRAAAERASETRAAGKQKTKPAGLRPGLRLPYSPYEGGRRARRARRLALRLVVLLTLAGLLAAGGLTAVRSVWFLGVDEGGRVALYRGLPYDLPLETRLYEERYSAPLRADRLDERFRQAVASHEWRSRTDAVDLVREIERSRGVR